MSSKQPPKQPDEEGILGEKPSLKDYAESLYGRPRTPAASSTGYNKPRESAYTGAKEERPRPRQERSVTYHDTANEKSNTQLNLKASQKSLTKSSPKLNSSSSQKLRSSPNLNDGDDGIGPDAFSSAVNLPPAAVERPCFVRRVTAGLSFTEILGYIIFFACLWYVAIIFASCLKTQLQKEFQGFFVCNKHPKN